MFDKIAFAKIAFDKIMWFSTLVWIIIMLHTENKLEFVNNEVKVVSNEFIEVVSKLGNCSIHEIHVPESHWHPAFTPCLPCIHGDCHHEVCYCHARFTGRYCSVFIDDDAGEFSTMHIRQTLDESSVAAILVGLGAIKVAQ